MTAANWSCIAHERRINPVLLPKWWTRIQNRPDLVICHFCQITTPTVSQFTMGNLRSRKNNRTVRKVFKARYFRHTAASPVLWSSRSSSVASITVRTVPFAAWTTTTVSTRRPSVSRAKVSAPAKVHNANATERARCEHFPFVHLQIVTCTCGRNKGKPNG